MFASDNLELKGLVASAPFIFPVLTPLANGPEMTARLIQSPQNQLCVPALCA